MTSSADPDDPLAAAAGGQSGALPPLPRRDVLPEPDATAMESSDLPAVEGETLGYASADWHAGIVEPSDFQSPPAELAADPASSAATSIPRHVGEYRIQRLIGSGGMGRVYLARHEPMQRVVALKTLLPQRMRQNNAVQRFYGEIRAAARLLHPNIVTAFDAGHANGVHYLAMEYVNGPTLATLVAEQGPLSIAAAVTAIRDAARGLAHAHAAGIIHRDVKPSNLMRTEDGTVKVVDLGLAAVGPSPATAGQVIQERDTGRLVGTIAFMSPEQLENADAVDARSDIYSLGATFYFLLTGRPPYEGEFLDQVRGHRHGPLPELFASRPDADLRLEHVLHRMMAKRPQHRYGALVEVIADLAIHDASEPIPHWIRSLSAQPTPADPSTLHSLSTQGEVPKVMALDWGMFYASAAVAAPSGTVQLLAPQGRRNAQHRLALADHGGLLFGEAAAAGRQQRPGSVIHCAQLYIGQTRMEHVIGGRRCPAEVLMALQMRHVMHTCWPERSAPRAVAITVPSCYDQLHRQAVLQAATIAGFRSVRLVDRSLAALQSWHLDLAQQHSSPTEARPGSTSGDQGGDRGGDAGAGRREGSSLGGERIDRHALTLSDDEAARPQLVISVCGNATEVVVVRRRGPRAQQLATVGQWHHGALQWQQKLVDLAAATCRRQHGFDPLRTLPLASSLQLACERAVVRFLLADATTIHLPHGRGAVAIGLRRRDWLEACEPLMEELLEMIATAIETADINPQRICHALLFGLPTRIAANRHRILQAIGPQVTGITVDRTDVARGAAACVAGELPGRGDIPLPPQPATCHSLGLLVADAQGRRRIRTMIPRGTAIPARTSRRIAATNDDRQTLTPVESSTWRESSWRSLGVHHLEPGLGKHNMELTFEVDMDGLLVIRRRDPLAGTLEVLPPRPAPSLDPEAVVQWSEWVAELLPPPKKIIPPR